MVRIYGASDDLVEIEGLTGMRSPCQRDAEELDDYDRVRVFMIGDEPNTLRVEVGYTPRGWEFSLSQPDNDDDNAALPFPVRIAQATGYSLAVVVDCPPGTIITWDGADDEDDEDEA